MIYNALLKYHIGDDCVKTKTKILTKMQKNHSIKSTYYTKERGRNLWKRKI